MSIRLDTILAFADGQTDGQTDGLGRTISRSIFLCVHSMVTRDRNGCHHTILREYRVRVNRTYYRYVLLSWQMLPAIKFIFQRDKASARGETIQLLQRKIPDFVTPDL